MPFSLIDEIAEFVTRPYIQKIKDLEAQNTRLIEELKKTKIELDKLKHKKDE